MFLEAHDLLNREELERLAALADRLKFVDGKLTNPNSQVKNNLQLDYADPGYEESSALLHGALMRTDEVRAFAMPRYVAPPLMTRYEVGMNYGAHADAALMQVEGRTIRSDLSCTIFLQDPSGYDGGELSIRLGARRIDFKLPAGSAVIYPSTTLHEVTPVTRGQRLVAITFIQSQVADTAKRELIYNLGEVLALEAFNMSWENRTRLSHVASDLTRMWADPG